MIPELGAAASSGWLSSAGTTFLLITLAEFGDKSQLVCMTLAARHRGLPVAIGAIAAFAHDEFGPIVDGNVKRLFCRLFGIEGQLSSSAVTNALWELAERYTPQHDNRAFAQGLLDMGATLCTPKNPACERNRSPALH